MPTEAVPDLRIRAANDLATRADGGFVLYWMIAARRRLANFGLQRAVELGRELGKPVLVLEALRCDYRWASDRLHAWTMKGSALPLCRSSEATITKRLPGWGSVLSLKTWGSSLNSRLRKICGWPC